jgi:hypothetical protein
MPKGRATPSTTSQPVALLGEAPPRVLVAPQQTRANSWQDVADLSAQFGIVLDEWQELVLQAAMGERANATWAAKRVGLSVPRQNGKSQLLVARILAGALLFGERKIVVSAHQQDTARESFTKLLEIVEADGNGALRARIKPNGIMQALNREAVKFTNGAVIQFKARSGPGGRGFSSDCLMLDEAQILSQRAWVSINSTMSAMPNPQVWLMGTPPTPEDDGEVFGNVRASAMSGKSSSVAWLEWAADPAADPNEELTRWAANPGWNVRINHEVVDGEAETYPPERFALDRLGIWATENEAKRIIPADAWTALATEDVPALNAPPSAMAVDASHDRTIAIAGCWMSEATTHTELLSIGLPTTSAVEWIVERAGRRIPVVIDSYSPASSLVPALRARKVKVVVVHPGPDMAKACGGWYDDVMGGRLTHADQAQLNDALAGAKQRKIGDAGGWGFDRKDPAANIAPLVASVLARFGAVVTNKPKSTKQGERKAVVL